MAIEGLATWPIWWPMAMVAHAAISAAYMAVGGVLFTVRSGQWRPSKLAMVMGAFSGSIGHGLQALQPLRHSQQRAPDKLVHPDGNWLGAWLFLEAIVSLYYLTLLKSHGPLLTSPSLFVRLCKHGRLADPEEVNALDAARKEAVAEISNASMMRGIFESSQSLVYVKDLHGRYLLTTLLFNSHFGLVHGKIIGQTDGSSGEKTGPPWISEDLEARTGQQEVEHWFDGPTGRRCFHSVKFPLHGGEGALHATCSITVDVTEKREAAAQTVEREAALAAAETKSPCFAMMSHEMRTPCTQSSA